MSLDDADELRRPLGIAERPVLQRLGVAADRRQRRAQLVGNVGHEVGTHRLEMTHPREVVEHQDRAVNHPIFVVHDADHAGRQHAVSLSSGKRQLALHSRARRAQRLLHERNQLGIATDERQLRPDERTTRGKLQLLDRGAVADHDPALVVEHDHAVDHAPQDRLELRALRFGAGELLAHFARERDEMPLQGAELVLLRRARRVARAG